MTKPYTVEQIKDLLFDITQNGDGWLIGADGDGGYNIYTCSESRNHRIANVASIHDAKFIVAAPQIVRDLLVVNILGLNNPHIVAGRRNE